jgi:hypothetical protein
MRAELVFAIEDARNAEKLAFHALEIAKSLLELAKTKTGLAEQLSRDLSKVLDSRTG